MKGTNPLDQIPAWTAADFTYSLNGTTVANPTNVGTYTINFSDVGLAKLAAAKNFAITPVYLGTYTITAADTTATLSTPSFAYDGTNASAETGLFATVNVLAGAGDDGGSTVKVALTSDDVTFSTDGANVGTYNYSLTTAGLTAVQTAVKNYTLTNTDATGSVAITAAAVDVGISTSSKIYDGTNISYTPTVTLSRADKGTTLPTIDWVAGDFEYAQNGATTTATRNAGDYTIQLSAQGQAKLAALMTAGNYTFTTTNGDYKITKKPLLLTATVATVKKVYGTKDPTLEFNANATPLATGDTLADLGFTATRASGEDIGPYKITSAITNSNYAYSGLNTVDFTITSAPATVSSANQSMTVNGTVPSYTASIKRNDGLKTVVTGAVMPTTGTLSNSDFVMTDASGNTIDPTTAAAGTYKINLTADALAALRNTNPNYTITQSAGTLTIQQAAGTVTINPGNKTYDGQAISDVPTVSVAVNAGTTTSLTPTQVTLVAGDYTITGTDTTLTNAGTYTIKLTAAGITKIENDNPNMAFTGLTDLTGTYTVNQREVTVTAGSDTKAYGEADPALTSTISNNLVAGDKLDYTVTRAPGEDVNSYTESIVVGDNTNYSITTVPGLFTITKAAVNASAISIQDGNKTYDGDPVNMLAQVYLTLNGVKTTLNWSSTITDTDFVYTPITGSKDLTDVGTYAITLSAAGIAKVQAVNGNYDLSNLANATAGTYTIAPATAAIQINATGKTYDGQTIAAPTVSITGIKDGKITAPADITLTADDYTTVKQPVADNLVDAGAYQIQLTEAGVAAIQKAFANFDLGEIASDTADYTISQEPATITVTGGKFAYDGQVHNPTATVTGAVAGEKLNYDLSTGLTYPGSKTVTATYDPTDKVNRNYDINVTTANLTVGTGYESITQGIKYQGAGDQTPSSPDQRTFTYQITSNPDTGDVLYTLRNATVTEVPMIAGYTATINGKALSTNADGTAYLPLSIVDGVPSTSLNAVPTVADLTVIYTANEEPVLVKATGNKADTNFTYTINGGADKLSGTYGTTLTGIHFGDTVTITPGDQAGYTATADTTAITVGTDETANTANVAYTANQQQISVNFVETNTGMVIGTGTLNGVTDGTYTIADPATNIDLDFVAGMSAAGDLSTDVINHITLLTLDSTKLPALSGTFAASDGVPIITIYYTMQAYTLNTDYYVANTDSSYTDIGAGTVSYDPATDKITYVAPTGSVTPPVDSMIKVIAADGSVSYLPLGASSGVMTTDELGPSYLKVSDDNTATASLGGSATFNPYFIVTQVVVSAKGNTTANNTFTYTVNGGEKLTGTYGTSIPDLVSGDIVKITPNDQAGYAYKQSNQSITVKTAADGDTAANQINQANQETVTYSKVGIKDAESTFGETPTYQLDVDTTDGLKTVTLTADDVDVLNGAYTTGSDGKSYLNAGSYDVQLNAAGLESLQNANLDFTFTDVTGKLVVRPKQITVTTGGDSKVYGTSDPELASSFDKSQLINSNDQLDYSVSREAGENVGSYKEMIIVGNNANYAIIPVGGLFKITPASTEPGIAATEVTTGDQTITYGDKTPTFGSTVSDDSKLTLDGITFTNKDFSFEVKNTDGTTSAYKGAVDANGVPTDKGTYAVNLNESGQAKVQAANGNYTLSADDFIAGTYTIKPKATTPDDAATEVTTGDQTITYGDKTPTFGSTV
ncbi:beta strand repeat-containing protein, partial [Loigolactobacillus iwatensis]|uniref:beta strand repeat-containing protein n=1 Tax=Loigolactobacillus iwatensis TaxID=1267156 RepID=UPI0013DE2AA3